jgi:hypothetical protein
MNTPRGFNPVGDHAAGLPRHDAPLPGHVPGQYTNTGGGSQDWSPSVGYRDPGFGPGFGLWSARIIMYCAIYLSVPVQMALYPIAGAVALVAGGGAYILLSLVGMEHDSVLSWVWTACFAGLVATMRTETRFETRYPSYRDQRHWFRLALCFVGMIYVVVHEQRESFGSALVISLITTAIAHFLLRMQLARSMWEAFQAMAWLRKE